MNRSIGILGCGWLGMPLAKAFIKDGYRVHGTTTSMDKVPLLKNEGILPFLITLTEAGPKGPISKFFEGIEILVINVPPGLRGGNRVNYVKKVQGLYGAIKVSTIKKVLFASSTSVYGNAKGKVTEDTLPRPSTESGRQLLEAENIFRNDKKLQVTIIRFGGLIGENRHPITLLSGKKGLANGSMPVNLIHLNDCISIIKSIVVQDWWNEIFNAVYPMHPLKKVYYEEMARKRGIPIPEYSGPDEKKGKKIASSKLILVKKYTFTTPI